MSTVERARRTRLEQFGVLVAERERPGKWPGFGLPTDVMTFCMSDVEGSTRLWETQPETMASVIVRHSALIAKIVEAHGGHFVKSMGEGDSTTSVFESAADALRAAIAANAALQAERWPGGAMIRARFGLHTGEAQWRDGVYLGATLNRAARVRGAGDGGEILLSAGTAALVAGDLPSGYAIVDLGCHRLKGIEQPEAIKALIGSGLSTAAMTAECPYRGLLAFEPQHRHLFFGREQLVADVLGRISPGRLLAVVGASGSGKSSLLRAGVVAAVQAGELPGMRSARVMTPGANPPLDLGGESDELLVVDQFEELYTQCQDSARRAGFIEALMVRPGPVVLGVRADFYGEIGGEPRLAAAVADDQVLLGPMTDAELGRAIGEPARLAGLRLEPGLLDLVLRDVAGEAGGLPLMSHALRATWERRNGRTLTVEAYRESGGVSSALAQTADAVVESVPEEDRPLLRSLFLRLTEIGGEVEDARRRVPATELVPEGAADGTVWMLLQRLADARLIILDEGTAQVAHEVLIRRWPRLHRWLEEDREGIRLHRRLSDAARLWDAAGREPTDLYRGTRLEAAAEWAHANGGQLNQTEREFLNASLEAVAQEQRAQVRVNRRLRRALSVGAGLLVAAIGLLIFAVVSRHKAVAAEASTRSQAVAATAESQLARDPELALLLARIALRDAPTPQAELAVSEALDANTLKAQLPSFGVQGCQEANFLFLFDGGRLAADNTCDGYVVFANLVSKRIVRRVRVGSSSTDMILGPRRRSLIVATGNHLVSVDVASGRTRRIFTAPFPIEQLAGRPGSTLAIANKYQVGLVNLRHGRVRLIARGDPSANVVNGMMWASPNLLLVASLGQTRGRGNLYPGLTVLDVANETRSTISLATPRHIAAVNFLRVSPDLRTWYITGADVNAATNTQVATTWAVDARTRRVRWVARGPLGATASPVQASSDGRLLGVGYNTGAADVLDAHTGRLIVRDSSSASIAAGDVAFPPGDHSLVTVSLDGVLRIWSARGSERLRFEAPTAPALAFTPEGRDIVLAGTRGELVDGHTGQLIRTFPGFPTAAVTACSAVCFATSPGQTWLTYLDPTSPTPRIVELAGQTGHQVAAVKVPRLGAQAVAPDGRIAAAYVDRDRLYAELIDPRSGQIHPLPSAQSSDGCAATTPSFSADGRLMAIVDGCIHLAVWDVKRGRIVRTIQLPDRSNGTGAVLTPDGRYVLATVLGAGFVRVDVRTGHVLEVAGAQAEEGRLVAVSPNGQFYAIGREDGTVDVYDARSLRLVRHHALVNSIEALAFSPGSQELAVEDTDNVVRVWDTCAFCENPRRLAAMAAKESVGQLTPAERRTFAVP